MINLNPLIDLNLHINLDARMGLIRLPFEENCQMLVSNFKKGCGIISKNYHSEKAIISKNSNKLEPSKVKHLLFDLRKSAKLLLEERIRNRSFLSRIDAYRMELEKGAKKNDIQQLEQTMRVIELRHIMRAAGNAFEKTFSAAIANGDPLTIEAIETSPVPFSICKSLLENGKKRRREVLKPLMTKHLHIMEAGQATCEGVARSAELNINQVHSIALANFITNVSKS